MAGGYGCSQELATVLAADRTQRRSQQVRARRAPRGRRRPASGGGSTARSAAWVTPLEHERRSGQPSARANAPSVSGRSPTTTPVRRRAGPGRGRPSAGTACRPRPARTPLARRHRGQDRARRPGSGRRASGRWRRRCWRSGGRRPRTAVARDPQPLVVEVPVEADHHRVGRRPSSRPPRPRAPRAPRRRPARRRRAPARPGSTSARGRLGRRRSRRPRASMP